MNNYRVLTLVNILAMVAIGISSPLLTLYLQGLGADFALISVILTSTIIVMLVGSYGWGWLADRLGRRKPLYVAGLAGVAIGYWWLSAANDVSHAWPARLLDGLSMAAVSTLGLALMGDTLDASAQRGRRMGLTRGLGSGAFAMGALMGGRLADAFGLSFIYIVCGAFFLAAMMAALFVREVRAVPAPVDPAGGSRKTGAGLPLLFLAGVGLWTMAHVASTSMWPNYMATFGYSKTAISSLWSLAAMIEFPAMYITGALSDVAGRAVMLAAGGFGIALVQIGYMLLAQSLPLLLGVQVLRGFGFGSYTASSMTFAAEFGGQQHRGSRSGLFNAAGSAGQLAGSMLGGNLVQVAGFPALFAVCSTIAVASAICFLVLGRRGSAAMAEHAALP
ncbi:MAG: MFS transporter [Caldilinea sp.]|nr:MFS transporter [Caldilineaceae bacterium]MCB9121008.1 MFS transporter [Caldilineaceae bacterium]MCW5841344.1 MFS transporter [Caldilinea sp.]